MLARRRRGSACSRFFLRNACSIHLNSQRARPSRPSLAPHSARAASDSSMARATASTLRSEPPTPATISPIGASSPGEWQGSETWGAGVPRQEEEGVRGVSRARRGTAHRAAVDHVDESGVAQHAQVPPRVLVTRRRHLLDGRRDARRGGQQHRVVLREQLRRLADHRPPVEPELHVVGA